MVMQRTFEVSHLKDYLRSAEGIHKMFEQLGYDVYDPEPLDAQDIDMSEADAQHVQAVYLINGMDFGHTIWLFEVDDTTTMRLRGLAYDVLQRAGTHTLVVTKDYREIIIAHPYFVGGTGKSHTRVNKLKIDSRNPTRHDVDTINALLARDRKPEEIYKSQDDAFNVNRVTNKFYKEYRDYFHSVQETVVAWNKGIAEFQNSDQRDKLHAFVQRLMGRLMFLYFLQRKGWLGGRSDFMTWQYKQMVNRHAGELNDKSSHYYREVLEPLFFDTLNKKRPENWTQWGVEIPYLNGGLFDRSRDPDGMIVLPDALFDPNSNTGLLAFFNRYNFTITDDAPMEQDVAVDPEMLGKVFENMLEEEDRGQSGSFYTPRTIVSYMCQEALAGYLEESAGIPRDETRRHFDPDDDITLTEEQAQNVSDALDTLTVLDPAVGSGSFLIGMLNEIITLRHRVAAALTQTVMPETIAAWKEAIIRDTLYGVDIKPGAIEIAQLRLWLSLVVNQTMADAKPLPNLDYKLMAGNSLIETIDGEPILSESAQQMINSAAKPQQPKLFDMSGAGEEARKLEDLRDEYFHADPKRRAELAKDIRYQERRIIEAGLNDMLENTNQRIALIERKYQTTETSGWKNADAKKYAALLAKADHLQTIKRDLWDDEATLPFFLYRLHFNDVFARKNGFDVVVANPPYVRMELFKEQKEELSSSYSEVYAGRADLYVYFFARAYNLLKSMGQISFVTSNKYLKANYGSGLRKFLSTKIRLQSIVDFGDLPIFDAAAYPCILLGSVAPTTDNIVYGLSVRDIAALENLTDAVRSNAEQLTQSKLDDNSWQISDAETQRTLQNVVSRCTPLVGTIDDVVFRGVVTGLNEAFVIDQDTRNELLTADPNLHDLIKPFVGGREVQRWAMNGAGKYVLFAHHGIDISRYPTLEEFLRPFKNKLENRATSNHEWYELQQPQMGIFARFSEPKIIYPDIAVSTRFALDLEGHYFANTAYAIPSDDKYLLGILNSQVVLFFYSQIASQIRGGYYRFYTQYVEQIPIPNAPDDLRQQIASLAQQCLNAAKDNPDRLPALEAELNQLVYQAYGLDEDDIRVIEGHLSGDAE